MKPDEKQLREEANDYVNRLFDHEHTVNKGDFDELSKLLLRLTSDAYRAGMKEAATIASEMDEYHTVSCQEDGTGPMGYSQARGDIVEAILKEAEGTAGAS